MTRIDEIFDLLGRSVKKGLAATALSAPLLLMACNPEPELAPEIERDAPSPALWQVENADGELEGWLFGTIHALPDGVTWKTPALEKAVSQSQWMLVEVDNLEDDGAVAAIFAELAQSGGLPPLDKRVSAESRIGLAELMRKAGRQSGDFTATETWAAALTLAQVDSLGDPANGVDRALTSNHCCVIELEGASKQLGIFDGLPETEQRDLLQAVVTESGIAESANDGLMTAWRSGEIEQIEAETAQGLLGDPELREALLTKRNVDWTQQIIFHFAEKGPLMIAVGAAHLVGAEGLPAMLEQEGLTISRIQ